MAIYKKNLINGIYILCYIKICHAMPCHVMLFFSQNGGASYIAGSNWPLRGAKSTLWEGGTRVPAFVYSKTLLKKPGFVTNE